MNKIELQTHLDNLFDATHNSAPTCRHFCWWEDDLQFLPRNHTKEKHPVFKRLTVARQESGLTSYQRDLLVNKIFDFIKEIEQCQKPSAH